ncbi:lysophosphatidylserine lipase ABHD12-like [Achroia grisella]|uniref:lysophosphatidylserine lipase ABHD12-like n=1 Tax=Achroia grisella TaxID=688607 RepID=UPI0027D2BBFC|nr:lysophosphatidylserine lipase ABHD12-like [Achroia grisella]
MVIGTILLTGASFTASLFVVQIAVLPLLFKYSKSVQRKMIFSNCINYPRNLDYENPSSCNIVGGRNFNIKFQSKVDDCPIKLGVWHIIPCSMFKDMFIIRDYKTIDIRLHHELKKTKNTIVLYCHGNSNHRASPHRVQMYKVFQKMNFHVIAFDYRGYGDSTRVRPTERGVVEDALKVYSWLNDSLDPDTRPAVLLWGHSLGTAVVANMISHMSELCTNLDMKCLPQPDAVVLEAPFNNLMDEIERHPFSKLVSWLPYYKDTFVKPFTVSSEYVFTTDQYLMKVPHVPILMMHSKCDKVVPYELAVKLHETVAQSRGPGAAPLHFHSFERGAGLGHNNLCEAPDLENIISDFLKQINTRNPE